MDEEPFDPAAEAASFCARAADIATYRGLEALADAMADMYELGVAVDIPINKARTAQWHNCEIAGVTLGELYGVAS
jgi:hypothetical protein